MRDAAGRKKQTGSQRPPRLERLIVQLSRHVNAALASFWHPPPEPDAERCEAVFLGRTETVCRGIML